MDCHVDGLHCLRAVLENKDWEKKENSDKKHMTKVSVHHVITKHVLHSPVYNSRMYFRTDFKFLHGNSCPHTLYCGMFFRKKKSQ